MVLLLISLFFQVVLIRTASFQEFYRHNIFLPLQRLRSRAFNHFNFSIGDVIYLTLLLLLLFLLIRLLVFLFMHRKRKEKISQALITFITAVIAIYSLFVLLWGGNYARPGIASQWVVADNHSWNDSSIVWLNKFLIGKLNTTALEKMPPSGSLEEVSRTARKLYTNSLGDFYDYLKIKPASLGNGLNYFGIQGYYNPLSGEGQFNTHLPDFMHPFVVAHEMAHQTGIAAEDDANLMAYIICSSAPQPVFRYSAYLNLFTYAFSELKEKLPQYSDLLWDQLNQKSKDDIAFLRQIRQHYKGYLRGFSLSLYDQYLLWQGQEKGLDSYNTVTRWVYLWEISAKKKTGMVSIAFHQ